MVIDRHQTRHETMSQDMQSGPRREGFWRSSMEPDLPMPIPDVAWAERGAFLKRFEQVEGKAQSLSYRGMSRCRVCGKPNGCATLSMTGWEWPSGLLHYVRDHGVKPSDGFIAFVDANSHDVGDGFPSKERTIAESTASAADDIVAIPTNDAETMAALRADTPLNRARAAFTSNYGRIEQAYAQRRPPTPIEGRRMEFEAVAAIAKALGVEIPSK